MLRGKDRHSIRSTSQTARMMGLSARVADESERGQEGCKWSVQFLVGCS